MSEKMLALVNYGAEPQSVELREIPVPEIGEYDVLLAVRVCGICGSDVHQLLGGPSWKVNYPVVLGHEFSGVIAKAGKGVRGFSEGDRVISEAAAVINPRSPYSRCGRFNLDAGRLGYGSGADGAMARFVKVPERCLHSIPQHLSFEKAAMAEPFYVAYNAACVNSHLRLGDTVAVIGPGPIGLFCALVAKAAGAGHIAVIGIPADAHRLDVAKKLCAHTVLGAKGENIAEWVRSFGDGLGFDVVIDATGVSSSLKLALEIVRQAGQITKVGWGPQPVNFSLDPLVAKVVTLQGSFGPRSEGNWPLWEKVISLLASGQLNPEGVLNRVLPLAEWREGFEEMRSKKALKVALQPS
jgi:alcohol dehydrogenase/L-iditol 2-dehydrogenase